MLIINPCYTEYIKEENKLYQLKLIDHDINLKNL